MKSTVRYGVGLVVALGLSGVALAQGSDPAASVSASDTKGMPAKKSKAHTFKKVNPKSTKADADSVSTGAPGDTAKGGQ